MLEFPESLLQTQLKNNRSEAEGNPFYARLPPVTYPEPVSVMIKNMHNIIPPDDSRLAGLCPRSTEYLDKLIQLSVQTVREAEKEKAELREASSRAEDKLQKRDQERYDPTLRTEARRSISPSHPSLQGLEPGSQAYLDAQVNAYLKGKSEGPSRAPQ